MALEQCLLKGLRARKITAQQAEKIRQQFGHIEDDKETSRLLESFISKSAESRRVHELKVVAYSRATNDAARGTGCGCQAASHANSRWLDRQ